jgi:ATP synthase protein I
LRNERGGKAAFRLIKAQLVFTLLATSIAYLLSGLHGSVSFLLGGLISVLPNACFALILFRHNGAVNARQIASTFYKGEAVKWVLTVGLFTLAFKYMNVVPMVSIIGFIVVQMTFWFAPFIIDNKNK